MLATTCPLVASSGGKPLLATRGHDSRSSGFIISNMVPARGVFVLKRSIVLATANSACRPEEGGGSAELLDDVPAGAGDRREGGHVATAADGGCLHVQPPALRTAPPGGGKDSAGACGGGHGQRPVGGRARRFATGTLQGSPAAAGLCRSVAVAHPPGFGSCRTLVLCFVFGI